MDLFSGAQARDIFFFDQIADDLPFPAGRPTGHDHPQELKSEASIRGRSFYHLTAGFV
jgi:hypothetical protein